MARTPDPPSPAMLALLGALAAGARLSWHPRLARTAELRHPDGRTEDVRRVTAEGLTRRGLVDKGYVPNAAGLALLTAADHEPRA